MSQNKLLLEDIYISLNRSKEILSKHPSLDDNGSGKIQESIDYIDYAISSINQLLK